MNAKTFDEYCAEETVSGDISTVGGSFGYTQEYIDRLIKQYLQTHNNRWDLGDFVTLHKIPKDILKNIKFP